MYYITSICFPSAINCSFDFFLQIDHVERVEPLESPLTSTENATPIVNEGQQLNSVSDLGREQQLASHSNEGSMPCPKHAWDDILDSPRLGHGLDTA